MQVNRIRTNDLKNEISISINDQEVFSGSSQEALFWQLRYRDTADEGLKLEIDTQLLLNYGYNIRTYYDGQASARQPQLAAA